MADANSPGKATRLRANNANIATKIDEAMTCAKARAGFRRPIGCVLLAESAKVKLHTRFAKVKLAVQEGHLVQANQRQYRIDRQLFGQARNRKVPYRAKQA